MNDHKRPLAALARGISFDYVYKAFSFIILFHPLALILDNTPTAAFP